MHPELFALLNWTPNQVSTAETMKGANSHLYFFTFPLNLLNEISKTFQNITSRFRGQTGQDIPRKKKSVKNCRILMKEFWILLWWFAAFYFNTQFFLFISVVNPKLRLDSLLHHVWFLSIHDQTGIPILLNLQISPVVKDEALTQCFMKDLINFNPKMPDHRESQYNVTTAVFGK